MPVKGIAVPWLSEEALEDVMIDILCKRDEQGRLIHIRPRLMWVPKQYVTLADAIHASTAGDTIFLVSK